MAYYNGPTQNNGQIRWWYDVSGVGQNTTHVTVSVDAYFYQVAPYHQSFNGSKSWSGAWGSGSGGQPYNLSGGQQVKLVHSSRSVALTDYTQSITQSVTAVHWFGTTSHTLSFNVPPRYARPPYSLSVVRVSDFAHTLNWARATEYSAVVVHRSTNDGAWVQVGRPTGNAYTWTDTTTQPGNKYAYRVAGVGGSGQSAWSGVSTVYTSPVAPTGVTAERVGTSISVDASGRPSSATSYNIRDGSTVVASGVSLPWVHVSPAPAETHQYTVQGVVSGLAGAWSLPSNTVQLISVPLAPTGLSPNGSATAADSATLFKWRHNPVDSSAQSAGEMQYRVKGVAAWTKRTVTTAQQLSILLPAAEYEWQVRTKGAHASWSPWSAVASLVLLDRPGVAVSVPGAVVTTRTVTVEWTFNQAQQRPQSAWEVVLSSAGVEVERRTGSGATRKVLLAAKLGDTDYVVTVRAATGDVWSEPAVQGFTVMVPPAAPADMSGVWSEESGAVTIEVQDGRGPARAAVTNHFVDPRFVGDGTWVEVFRNLVKASTLSDSASGWTVNGTNFTHAPTVGGRSFTAKQDVASLVSLLSTATAHILPFPASTEFVYSIRVRNDGAFPIPVELAVFPRRADQSNPGSFNGERVTLSPGEERMLVTSGTTTADTVDLRASIRTGGSLGTFPSGGVLTIFDGITLLAGTQKPVGLISGELESPDPDMRSRWIGAAYNSETVLEGERVRGMSPGTGSVFIVSQWEGKPAGRLMNLNGAASSCYAGFPVPAALRDGGVFVATRHQREVISAVGGAYNLMVANPSVTSPAVNEIGSRPHRLEYGKLTSTYMAYFGSRANPGGGDVYYTDPGLFEPGYTGPAFHGSTGLVDLDGSWMAATWDGVVDNSTSTIRPAPAAARVDVERSVDGGATWETIITDAALPLVLTDTEALSNGVTTYRVTTYSADDAMSVAHHDVHANSGAVWLSGGNGYTNAARLPYSPTLSITAGRQRVTRQYAGRELPVTHVGETRTRIVDSGGLLILEEQTPDNLADLVQDPSPIHLYRDPDGRRIYGALGDIQLQRESHAHWGFGFQLTETEH